MKNSHESWPMINQKSVSTNQTFFPRWIQKSQTLPRNEAYFCWNTELRLNGDISWHHNLRCSYTNFWHLSWVYLLSWCEPTFFQVLDFMKSQSGYHRGSQRCAIITTNIENHSTWWWELYVALLIEFKLLTLSCFSSLYQFITSSAVIHLVPVNFEI